MGTTGPDLGRDRWPGVMMTVKSLRQAAISSCCSAWCSLFTPPRWHMYIVDCGDPSSYYNQCLSGSDGKQSTATGFTSTPVETSAWVDSWGGRVREVHRSLPPLTFSAVCLVCVMGRQGRLSISDKCSGIGNLQFLAVGSIQSSEFSEG